MSCCIGVSVMPLWSNEEWRARIGSSWCALGLSIKCRSSNCYGRGRSWTQQLSQAGGIMLQVVSMVMALMMMALAAIALQLQKEIKECELFKFN